MLYAQYKFQAVEKFKWFFLEIKSKIKNAWSPGDEHIFNPKGKSEAKVDQKENTRSGESRINEEYAQFWDRNPQFSAHSCKNTKPLPFHGMSEVIEHV